MTDKIVYHVLMNGLVYNKYDTLNDAKIDLKRVKNGILQNIEIKEEEIDELNDTLNTLTIQEVDNDK